MLALLSALLALQAPGPAGSTSRRAAVFAAPLVVAPSAAHAFNPLDLIFGWIPPVEAPAKAPEEQLTTAEKIRKRRKELEALEVEKQAQEYAKNRGNSAASRATDIAGANAVAN
jgi:hypothetical protein